MFFDF